MAKDYHKNTNTDNFTDWLQNNLLPSLAAIGRRAMLLMDNAPYPCTYDETKKTADMVAFCNSKDVPVSRSDGKCKTIVELTADIDSC